VRILAIDTSSEIGAVALLEGGALRASLQARVMHQHGETLLPHVDRVLGLAGVSLREVDLLAVGLGPGSFTGTRIGVATAKGLALAHGTAMIGVRTSRVLARAATGALRLVAIDAKKDEVFVAAYAASGPGGALVALLEDVHGTPTEVAQRLASLVQGSPSRATEASVIGSAVAAHRAVLEASLPELSFLPDVLAAPSAALLAQEALEAHAARGPDDPAALVPVYVRGADAKLPESPAKPPQ
jgi:tRNA threonylcarbamoyladenosine biosynthesis protein TsaB